MIKWLRQHWTGRRQRQAAPAAAKRTPAANSQAPSTPPEPITTQGSQQGWLRVLTADELLTVVQAQAAIGKIAEQSKLAQAVWRRDLLAAIRNYAEFVQLMPASESHHHAHPGGLLVHTLEVLIAAMTWRNGHFLPEGDTIERVDSQRDQWTYVVFFAALLHDIAKPMTDLRITWRAQQMPEALRWTPIAGSLVGVCRGHKQPEYRVAFTPKSQRDYTAHSRLALILLHQIAPDSALHMLAGTPDAMDALASYLSAQDKSSLVARIVQHADRASTARALRQGVRTRFATATSVPLVELLMTAVRSMLKNGTELPLNRTGAAGWVYDGSVWFAAKRLADATRLWIAKNAPDESIPGEQKNDRLFDTWQEYGCINPSPQTGQAIWYVTIKGTKAAQGQGSEAQDNSYEHKLSLLRFPLEKLYESADLYPPEMNGRIELRERPQADADKAQEVESASSADASPPQEEADPAASTESASMNDGAATTGGEDMPKTPSKKIVRQPAFNKPKVVAAAEKAAKAANPNKNKPKKGKSQSKGSSQSAESESAPAAPKSKAATQQKRPAAAPAPAAEQTKLDQGDDVSARDQAERHKKSQQEGKRTRNKQESESKPPENQKEPDAASGGHSPRKNNEPGDLVETTETADKGAPQRRPSSGPAQLEPDLPSIPGLLKLATSQDPSEGALAFMDWIKEGLRDKTMPFNQAGAMVHFTNEGLALVSPRVFKVYASVVDPECDPEKVYIDYQREFFSARWHYHYKEQGKGISNILKYEISGRGGKRAGSLSVVVLKNPRKWVDPVPPANPALRLVLPD